jgi:hypothetical protein
MLNKFKCDTLFSLPPLLPADAVFFLVAFGVRFLMSLKDRIF